MNKCTLETFSVRFQRPTVLEFLIGSHRSKRLGKRKKYNDLTCFKKICCFYCCWWW